MYFNLEVSKFSESSGRSRENNRIDEYAWHLNSTAFENIRRKEKIYMLCHSNFFFKIHFFLLFSSWIKTYLLEANSTANISRNDTNCFNHFVAWISCSFEERKKQSKSYWREKMGKILDSRKLKSLTTSIEMIINACASTYLPKANQLKQRVVSVCVLDVFQCIIMCEVYFVANTGETLA